MTKAKKNIETYSAAPATKLSTEELELLNAAKEMKRSKQQREKWNAQLADVLAQAKAAQTIEQATEILRESAKPPAPIQREVPLRRPKVTVRVRPLAKAGGHSNEGEPVSKRLASWDNGTIVLEDEVGVANGSVTGASRATRYTFAQAVLGPDVAQLDVHRAAAAGLVKAFMHDGYNGLLFAYGQTGTGKTHTVFGPEPSWRSIHHEQAGLLPRAVASVLEMMRQKESTISATLTASAMEFYMSSSLDLLADNAPCLIGPDYRPIGLVSVPIDGEASCLEYMARVRASRHTRATAMNMAADGHEGSSRSHAAMILTLRQLERSTGIVTSTELHIIDMAGAERPKTVESAQLALWDHEAGKDSSVASQGLVINSELSALRTAVVQATEQHVKGLPLLHAKKASTDFVEYTKSCLSGSALLSMIVTLSPARSCGWETWFSCTYGEDLQKLRCPVQPQKGRNLAKLIASTEAALHKATEDVRSRTELASDASKRVGMYLTRRAVQLRHDTHALQQLQRLAELGAAGRTACVDGGLFGGACAIS